MLQDQGGAPKSSSSVITLSKPKLGPMATALEGARYDPAVSYAAREWIVEGLFSRLSLVGWLGPEKAQKSMMALRLAMHIASGRGWFGFNVPQARKVVYVDAENPSEEIDLRYKAMLLHFEADEQQLIETNLSIIKGRELIDKQANIEVENSSFWKALVARYSAEVYILDAFQMFHSKNEISNKEIKKVMLDLRHFCGPNNCLIILHHTRKREERGIQSEPILMRNVGARIWSDRCLGAGVFKRLADVIICQELAVKKVPGLGIEDWTVDFAAFGRIIADVSLLEFREDGEYWHRLDTTLTPSLKESYDKLRAARGPWESKNAAAKVLGLSRSQGNVHISQLVQRQYLAVSLDGETSIK
jgi:hypothetical protein